MKNLRRAFALVLALALTFAMGITAMANPSPTGKIQNETVLTKTEVTAPAGSSVLIGGIVAIGKSDPVRTSLDSEVSAAGVAVEKLFLMEVQATGSGEVQFYVGKEYAGKTVICWHYSVTAGKWEKIGTGTVDANGYCKFSFTSFSPVALTIAAGAATTTATTATTAATKATTATATTSPKTGDMIFVVELFALACLATAVIAGRKAKQI